MRAIKLRCSFEKGYAEGYAAAIEEAANEVRSYMYEKGLSVQLIDLANQIEALLPKGTK